MPLPHWLVDIRRRIGHDLLLIPGVSAMIFNDQNEVLLQRRSDNGLWSTIGGVQEPGEQPADAIVREVLEETGLNVIPTSITGIYSSPTITYPNGDQVQYTTTQFLCRPVDPNAQPKINDDESLELKYFPMDQLPPDLRPDAAIRIAHAAQKRQGRDTVRFLFRGTWQG